MFRFRTSVTRPWMAACVAAPPSGRLWSRLSTTSVVEQLSVEDISIEDTAASSSPAGEAAAAEDVPTLDQYAKAKVINFFKRFPASSTDERCVIEESRTGPLPIYKATMRVVLPSAPTKTFTAVGFALNTKDAEVVAAMHAARIVDAAGLQMYTLPSMQKKHAASAREMGRWAPEPTDKPKRDFEVPKPLRFVTPPDETEGGQWQLVRVPGPTDAHVVSPPHTLLSPAVYDPNAGHRVKKFVETQCQLVFDKAVVVKMAGDDFVATIPLPVSTDSELLAKGRAASRSVAVALAAMHAELLLDYVGASLHSDEALQAVHVATLQSFGRAFGRAGTAPPPLPLRERREPSSPMLGEEPFFAAHHKTSTHDPLSAVVMPKTLAAVDWKAILMDAVQQLTPQWLQSHDGRRELFVTVKLASAVTAGMSTSVTSVLYRTSFMVPSHTADTVHAVGFGSSSEEAEKGCALHAVWWLHKLGVVTPEANTTVPIHHFASAPESVPSVVFGAVAPAPPPKAAKVKAVASAPVVPAVDGGAAAPAASDDVFFAVNTTPNTDGDDNATQASSSSWAVASPSVLDRQSRARITKLFESLGKDPAALISVRRCRMPNGAATYYRAEMKLPMPFAFGDRFAIGEGLNEDIAIDLAMMHAELTYDALALAVYLGEKEQALHASACAAAGRSAPRPGDPPASPTTPSPLPLRDVALIELMSNNGATSEVLDAHNGLEEITTEQLDATSRPRVLSFLKRTRRPCDLQLVSYPAGHEVRLDMLFKPRTVVAVGAAQTKRDAEILCFMHAERVIDAMGVPLFNLAGLQKRHAERVRALGRTAPLLGDPAPDPTTATVPPGLRLAIGVASKPTLPLVPTDMDMDVTSWNAYVAQCEAYVAAMKLSVYETTTGVDVPRTDDAVIDAASDDIRGLPTDKNAKSRLMNYCSIMGVNFPTQWTSSVVGGLTNRRTLTQVPVPSFEHVTAIGLGSNKDESQRRATMHVLALLRRLDPDWMLFEEAEREGRSTSSKSGGRRVDNGSFDRSSKSFTYEGKVRLLHLFTLCCGLPPPQVEHRQRRIGTQTTFITSVTITDHAGEKFVGTSQEAGHKTNETAAFTALFDQLYASVPPFVALASIVKSHPHLDPDHVVSLTMPDDIVREITSLTDIDVAAGASAPQPATPAEAIETSTRMLAEATASPEDVQRVKRLQAYLAKKRQLKLANPEYQAKFVTRRETLSIWQKKDELLATIAENPVTILCGTTGCGKTTQVPQYLLDHEVDCGRGGQCQILVTQPRRISAISIAQRIAAERMETIGDVVGYSIRLDSKPGSNINFCTSGVLLRLFQTRPNLDGVKYVIIDEIHERDINSDFLLILAKDLVARRPDIRIILMSATLQSEAFRDYFGGQVPIINVTGFTYPVRELYLEDVAELAKEKNFISASVKAIQSGDTGLVVLRDEAEKAAKHGLLEAPGEIDVPSIVFTVEHVAQKEDVGTGSILVFLPGWDDIVKVRDSLLISTEGPKYHILPLHSSVSSEEQLACFAPPPEGKIKVVLATNIAESGVTIDDVHVVIDVGRAKEKAFVQQRGRTAVSRNDVTTMSRLVTVLASKANSTQRRGRAGRTRPGVVFRMYPRNQFQQLHEFQTPEIHRTTLDSLCLQILALGLGDPGRFLQRAIEPPNPDVVSAAMNRLHDLGAINERGELTVLGKRLAMLPVAPHVAKMVLMGAALNCLDSVLTVASTFDVDPFLSQREQRELVRLNREDLSRGAQSDHIINVNAYNTWANARVVKTPEEVQALVNDSSFSQLALMQISRYKHQYRDILLQSGFLNDEPHSCIIGLDATEVGDEPTPPGATSKVKFVTDFKVGDKVEIFIDRSTASANSLDIGLVKSVVCSALFPNVSIFRDKKRFRNKLENNLYPQSSSIAAKINVDDITNPFFIYEEMVKSSTDSRVLFRGVTNVSFWSIVLLGTSTRTQIQFRDDLNLAVVDGWIIFRVEASTLEMVYRLKAKLSQCIERKFIDPNDEANNAMLVKLRDIVRALVNLPMKPNEQTDTVWTEQGELVPVTVPPELDVSPEEQAGESDAKAQAPKVRVQLDPEKRAAESGSAPRQAKRRGTTQAVPEAETKVSTDIA